MAASSKEEYLKKYLSVNAEEKKKKKKRKPGIAPAKIVRSRIVDDDVDFKSLLPENLSNTLEEDVGDNEPVVADFVDERPEHVKLLEKYRMSGAWKVLGDDDERKDSQRHNSDSDQSPHRRKRHDSDSDQSPQRTNRHDSDSDQSLPRTKRHDSDSDQSPQRTKRHDSDSDQSPPRKKSSARNSSQIHNSKSDLKRKRYDSSSDQSPERKQRHDSDSDQSPPRRQRHDSDSDQSPSRKQRQDSDSDQSPPRKQRHDSDSDQSPPRKMVTKEKDSSPPRRKRRNSDSGDNAKIHKSQKQSSYKNKTEESSEKTLSGKRAGLSSAQEMRREAEELKRKEDAKFREISDERLGKGAATVFRDKSGRKRNIAEEKLKESEEAKKKAKMDEKFQQWGKGLKQIEEQSQQVQDALHEADKPLARYKDDEDLDKMLRDMDRAEDPMLAFITKKKIKNAGPPKKEKPRYKGPAPPPNRFGIMPGYRWDGVDRSNGFEKQVYSKQAERKATSEQAYKWSVEDM